jgi:protein-disulfide isomerase
MTDQRNTPGAPDAPDDHYQPWLRNQQPTGAIPPSPADSVLRPAPLPTRGPDLAPARPTPTPRAGEISADELLARPVNLPQPVPPGPGIGARIADALAAFADWTIDLGERADVPAKVARLELGERLRSAGGAIARLSRSGAEKSADALRSGAHAAAPKLRAAAEAAKDGIARGAQEAKSGLGSGAERIGDAARALKDAVPTPARAEPPVIESQLDRLLAEEAAPPERPLPSDSLPLFAHEERRAPSVAEAPAVPEPVSQPDPAASPVTPSIAATTVAIDDRSPAAATTSATSRFGDNGSPAGRSSLRDWSRQPATWALGAGFLLASGFAAGLYWTGPGVDRATTERVIHDYLLNNPQILPQAMERLQANQAAEVVGRLRTKIETPFSGAWAGAADGDVVLTVFTDYACTFCRASVPDIDRLLREDRKLKVVFRELPILSPDSDAAARLALVAARRGQYMPMHRALFESGHPNADARREAAIALDVSNDAAAINDPAIGREIENNLELARQLRVDGTPSWVVGDRVMTGAVGYDQLRAAIAAARAR